MSRNVLITGPADLLGSHLVARRLLTTDDVVFCAIDRSDEPRDPGERERALCRFLERRTGEGAAAVERRVRSRLHWVTVDFAVENLGLSPDVARVDEIWHTRGVHRAARRRGARASATRNLLASLPRLGATELNYVSTAALAGETPDRAQGGQAGSTPAEDDPLALDRIAERDVAQGCGARGVGHRIFRPSLLVGEPLSPWIARADALLELLAAVHGTKLEIEERLPEFFEYNALRCWAPEGASLNLIRVEHAVELMQRIAGRRETLGGRFDVVSPTATPFADLCERLGRVYELSLVAVDDRGALTAIDRLFEQRLRLFHSYLRAPQELDADANADAAHRAADLPPTGAALDEGAEISLLEALRHDQEAGRRAAEERARGVLASFERKTIDGTGGELTYHVGGAGRRAIAIVNAIGQGLHYWGRLIDALMRQYRLIIWEPRGTAGALRPFSLENQVDDLEAILRQEGVKACQLCAWCTGPKVAMELYLRRPELVASMVFISGAFKRFDGLDGFNTPYEQTLEQVFRMIDRRPEAADTVMSSFQAMLTDDTSAVLEETDAERLSTRVLSLMNRDLREDVLAPFRSPSMVVNYARQLLDFWSHDVASRAPRVQAPVLLIGAEQDRIASPEMSRAVARHFPSSRHVELQGATHYAVYDRPALLAEIIEAFLEDPDGLDHLPGEARITKH